MVPNACATQALLSVLLNREGVIPDIGEELTNLKNNTLDMDGELKGLAIGHCETIRNAHNSFRKPEGISVKSRNATEDDDVFHFISYIPWNGHIYELDGLREGPIQWAEIADEETDFLVKMEAILNERVARYQGEEIRFALLGLTKPRKDVLEAQLMEMLAQGMTGDLVEQVQQQILAEEEKREAWKNENIRRRHNYIPFVFALLRSLAEKNKLSGLVEFAQSKAAEKK